MAFGFLSPIKVSVTFENRAYKLGESIDFRVQMKPKRNVKLREAWIDLVCEENYVETSIEMMNDLTGGSHGTTIGNSSVPLGRVPKRITKRHRNRFIHSSVTFSSNAYLIAGRISDYTPTMPIRPYWPPHAYDGQVKWVLEITANLAGSRDFIRRKAIIIKQ